MARPGSQFPPTLITIATGALLLAATGAALAQPEAPTDRSFDDHSLCLPTGDPPPWGYEPYTGAVRQRGQVVVGGVPGYQWRHGCGPTAAGMVLGYWDGNGFSALVAGSASDQSADVNQMIASGNGDNTHYSDYSLPIDDEGTGRLPDESYYGGAHASHCVADYMRTSWYTEWCLYGWSYMSFVDDALRDYVAWVNAEYATSYTCDSWNEYFGTFGWNDFVAEIDAGRPMVFLVDTDGDDSTDHFVTAIGYRDTQGYQEYACLDTWAPAGRVRWERFREMDSGVTWGIRGATYCIMGSSCPASFTQQPVPSQQICEGYTGTLQVAVDATSPQHQWRRGATDLVDDGVHIFGATTDTLSIFEFGLTDEGDDYNCVVYEAAAGCYIYSDYAELQIDTTSPVITLHPEDVVAEEGTWATFDVEVENPVLYDFQWRKDGEDLVDGGRISGAMMDRLMIVFLEPADAGEYDCAVTAQLGGHCFTISDAATLTVTPQGDDCPEDLVEDGVINLQDLAGLLGNYGLTGATPDDGDFDSDGDVDLSDLAQLLGVYGLDCPTQ